MFIQYLNLISIFLGAPSVFGLPTLREYSIGTCLLRRDDKKLDVMFLVGMFSGCSSKYINLWDLGIAQEEQPYNMIGMICVSKSFIANLEETFLFVLNACKIRWHTLEDFNILSWMIESTFPFLLKLKPRYVIVFTYSMGVLYIYI